MNSVIIFDVSNNQTAVVRQLMAARGYYLNWASIEGANRNIVNLPHNIVWRPNTESQQAIDDIEQVVAGLNVPGGLGMPTVLLRCVVLNSTPWKAIYGNPV